MESLRNESSPAEIKRLGCRIGGTFTAEEIREKIASKSYAQNLRVVRGES